MCFWLNARKNLSTNPELVHLGSKLTTTGPRRMESSISSTLGWSQKSSSRFSALRSKHLGDMSVHHQSLPVRFFFSCWSKFLCIFATDSTTGWLLAKETPTEWSRWCIFFVPTALWRMPNSRISFLQFSEERIWGVAECWTPVKSATLRR